MRRRKGFTCAVDINILGGWNRLKIFWTLESVFQVLGSKIRVKSEGIVSDLCFSNKSLKSNVKKHLLGENLNPGLPATFPGAELQQIQTKQRVFMKKGVYCLSVTYISNGS